MWIKYLMPVCALGHWGLWGLYLSQGRWCIALWFGLMAWQATARTAQVWSERTE